MTHKVHTYQSQLGVLIFCCFILIASTVFVPSVVQFPRYSTVLVTLADRPVVVKEYSPPGLSSQAALVVDPQSGVALFDYNSDTPLPPVSTTKMVTALVAMQGESLSSVVEVPSLKIEPQIMKLSAGERIFLRDLLYGTLVWSANDAAEVIAQTFPGGREKFIDQMNQTAHELGMSNTYFLNPSGLPQNGHVSTARDLARLTTVAMQNLEFAKIVGTREITVRSIDGRLIHKLTNLNELLYTVPGVLGVKTGWSEETGGALVTYVRQNGHPLVIVVLGSQDRFGESKALIDWAYQTYNWYPTARNTH